MSYNKSVRSGHKLSEIEFSHLYHLLDDEVKRARIGRPARASFRLLEATSYLLPFVLSLAYLLNYLGPRLSPAMQTLVDDATARLGGLVLLVLAAIVVLFIVNLPLLRKAYRQWRLSRRLVALRLLDYATLPPPRLGLKFLALLPPIGFLILFLYGVFDAPAESIRQRVAPLILLVFLPVALFLADRLLRRLRGRLQYFEEVRAVRTELAAAGESGGEPVLSQELLTRIADVERARLLQGRAEAAASQRSFESETSYAVRKSDSVLATLRGLDASERVKIEEALENLALRHASRATEISKVGPPATLHVEDTPWQVVYEIETATLTIHIIAIRGLRDYS